MFSYIATRVRLINTIFPKTVLRLFIKNGVISQSSGIKDTYTSTKYKPSLIHFYENSNMKH